jgi:uncharacterized membrane protein
MNTLPLWVHELLVAPLALALAYTHARQALGPARAALELLCLVSYGFVLEHTAILVFSSHAYGPEWRLAPLGVPLAVAAAWAAVIVAAMALAARLGPASPLARGAAAALVGVSLDLLMEPVAVQGGRWRWTPPGPWLEVPVGNFVGWAVIVGAYTLGGEHAGIRRSLAGQASARVALAGLSIACLVLVGLTWRRLGVERVFSPTTGWIFAICVFAATAGLGFRRWIGVLARTSGGREGIVGRERTPPRSTLAGRLAVAPGRAPSLVILLVFGAFAADALLLARPQLATVLACAALALLPVVAAGWAPPAPPLVHATSLATAWGRAALSRYDGVQDVFRVLMKPRNGTPWSEEDRIYLRAELRHFARWTPAFFLFLVPGSMVLLPIYAWMLDRRRRRR